MMVRQLDLSVSEKGPRKRSFSRSGGIEGKGAGRVAFPQQDKIQIPDRSTSQYQRQGEFFPSDLQMKRYLSEMKNLEAKMAFAQKSLEEGLVIFSILIILLLCSS